MKKYLRIYLFNLVALWIAANILKGISFKNGFSTLGMAALVLSLTNIVVKPLINLLLLPLNLLTLGMFRWVTNIAALYLVTLVVPEFEISSFNFPGWSYHGFVIPAVFLSKLWVLILTSLIISFIISFLTWLSK